MIVVSVLILQILCKFC